MKPISALFLALALAGCEPGRIQVRIWGEEFIEKGIPASEFVDGWSVKFSRFMIVLGDVTVAQKDEPPALIATHYHVRDLTQEMGGGELLLPHAVPPGVYNNTHYRVAMPAVPRLALGPGVSDENSVAVFEGLCSLLVSGEARNGMDGRTRRFDWCFKTATRYGGCASNARVELGGSAKTQITIHGDHLFHDDLFSSTPNTAFELIARADSDNDGDVSEAELRALDISKELRYQVGSTRISNLWDFIAYQTGSIGHIDGEGHCVTLRE